MRCAVAIVLMVTLVFLLTTLIIVIMMPNLPEASSDQLCVTRSEDGSLRCGYQRDVLAAFLSKAMNESYETTHERTTEYFRNSRISLKNYVDNQYWEMKPAVRLTGGSEVNTTEADKNADMVPVRSWKSGRNLVDYGGFKRYGISVRNGRIAVPVTGTYFIYSHLNLYHPSTELENKNNIDDKNGTIKHSMYKYNFHDNKETELLTALTPPTEPANKRYNYYTSYVSGLVQLTAGEEVSLKISNVHLLRYHENNYVGVNMV